MDTNLRNKEKAWLSTPTEETAKVYLREMLRCGVITPLALELVRSAIHNRKETSSLGRALSSIRRFTTSCRRDISLATLNTIIASIKSAIHFRDKAKVTYYEIAKYISNSERFLQ